MTLWRVVRTARDMRRHSVLLLSVIAGFMLCYMAVGFALFYRGIAFFLDFPGIGRVLLDRMFYLFFAFLFLMLMFSHLVIGYSSFFRSRETEWWLTLPMPSLAVFGLKAVETMVLASWAFGFLSVPLLGAYGVARGAPPGFYLATVCLSVPFVVVSGFPSMVILLLVAGMTRRARLTLMTLGAAGVCALAWIIARPMAEAGMEQTEITAALDQLMNNARLAMHPALPSAWLARSLLAAASGVPSAARQEMVALGATAAAAAWSTFVVAVCAYPAAYSAVQSRGGGRRIVTGLARRRRSWPARPLPWLPGVPGPDRALALKDLRTFMRDPAQWSQFAIFFGLLGFYILNLRNVPYDLENPFWINTISFLNLGAASMTLSTLTTRFVFPQFSLEGRRLWIVGMAPIGLRRVLWQKFALSVGGTVVITLALIVLSCSILRVSGLTYAMSVGTVILMSLGLSGLAVGLGALYPNFREDNPSRIVSGFGGTLCLLLSLLYVTLTVALQAFPMHYQVTRRLFAPETFRGILALVWLAIGAMTILCGLVPMLLASRAVARLEIPQGQ